MKILLATPYKQSTGGITRWAEYIVDKALEEKSESFELDVLPMNDPKGDRFSTALHSSLLSRLQKGIRTYWHAIGALKRRLATDQYDVLHIASSGSISFLKDLWMIQIAKRRGVKSVIHCHFGRIPQIIQQKGWEWRLLQRVLVCANKVMVIDHASYDAIRTSGYCDVVNIPNPLSPDIVRMVEQADRIDRVPRRILFVGHCIKTKGVFELVEACRQIPQVELRLVGAVMPEIKKELREVVAGASWLKILGNLSFEDVIREMLQCDVFVLPTYTEGFPNVILESMACGCPIVTTPVGAIPQMLEIGSDVPAGVCVPPRNVVALRDAIESLLNDSNRKEQLSIRAKTYVTAKYSLETVWAQMVAVWQQI